MLAKRRLCMSQSGPVAGVRRMEMVAMALKFAREKALLFFAVAWSKIWH